MIPVPLCNLFALSWKASQVIAVVIPRPPPCARATFFSETPARRSEQSEFLFFSLMPPSSFLLIPLSASSYFTREPKCNTSMVTAKR
ncbi:uncharacterized protein C8R40DRAFT_1106776 [Lentinula edodes]|uniref:uncharacterized protein n=1 Tax=Lentinula edodes TaxID=5353 RepID=UPI001E8EA793|nr:uncharacterized protein C8R40DRAFT_1106776 [Lentinula edodes]KAH7874523.1 hypothetical protein C8R40DRAFT_1106776 [Lentinula edodes]